MNGSFCLTERSSDSFLYAATPSRAFLLAAQWLILRRYISGNLQLRDSSGLSPDSQIPSDIAKIECKGTEFF